MLFGPHTNTKNVEQQISAHLAEMIHIRTWPTIKFPNHSFSPISSNCSKLPENIFNRYSSTISQWKLNLVLSWSSRVWNAKLLWSYPILSKKLGLCRTQMTGVAAGEFLNDAPGSLQDQQTYRGSLNFWRGFCEILKSHFSSLQAWLLLWESSFGDSRDFYHMLVHSLFVVSIAIKLVEKCLGKEKVWFENSTLGNRLFILEIKDMHLFAKNRWIRYVSVLSWKE